MWGTPQSTAVAELDGAVREHGVGGVPGGLEGVSHGLRLADPLSPVDKPGHHTGAIPGQEAHSRCCHVPLPTSGRCDERTERARVVFVELDTCQDAGYKVCPSSGSG